MKKTIIINGTPCYLLETSSFNKEYTIFLYHGWGSSKDTQVFLGEILAHYGYNVIIPDAPYHGERKSIITDFFSKESLLEFFWRTIFKAVEEADELIEESIRAGYARENKIIIAGSSMGGCIASGVVANNPKTAGLVSMMGSAAWEYLEKEFRKVDGREPLTEEERKSFCRLDPINKWNNLKNKKLLLLHGKNDQIIPLTAQKEFYLQASEILGDNVSYQEFDQVGHTISLRMAEELINWLRVNFS